MKLFVGICIIVLSLSQFSLEVLGRSHIWRGDMYRSRMAPRLPNSSGSMQPDPIPGPTDKFSDPVDRSEPPVRRNVGQSPLKSSRKQLSVKFVLKDGYGNVENQEQVTITAGKRLRVLDSTDGYITVLYRDHKGFLTRIEKIRLPEHLPKETIPAGGLVISRAELPWEPSINPVEVEVVEVGNTKPLNNEYQNINEKPSSSRARTAPEGINGSRSLKQQSSTSSIDYFNSTAMFYIRTIDASGPLRLKSSSN